MKIAQLYIQDLQQFRNFQLDLTYPEGHAKAGQAMDKICLLGLNGSGKSNLLALILDYLRNVMRFKSKALFLAKLQVGERFIYGVHLNNTVLFFRDTIEAQPEWMIELMRDQNFTMAFNRKYEQFCIGFEEEPELFDTLWLDNNSSDLICFQPSDFHKDHTIKLVDSPITKGHEAESLSHTFPLYSEISPERISEFWSLLIYLIAKRGRDFQEFSQLPENKGKATAVLTPLYEAAYPQPLPGLAKLWAPYLDPLGIEVALDTAELPGHFRDRLSMLLRRKHDGQRVDYGQLGTGLRRLLFNLGHIWALNFGREIRNGFLFLEEPESNLHPALLKDLLLEYQMAFPGAQQFVATHHPLVASQFAAEERVIISRSTKGEFDTRRGLAAAGSSLDELLSKDFA